MKKFQVKFIALAMMVWFGAVSVVLGSEYADTVTIARGTHFWNVEGSTHDPKIKVGGKEHNWIDAWKHFTGKIPPRCITQGCTTPYSAVGGHVVFDSTNVKPKQTGAINSVYILPICGTFGGCNASKNTGRMTTKDDIIAVRLKNYNGMY